ncbi:hypothetical protein [Rhodococcus koreensis]
MTATPATPRPGRVIANAAGINVGDVYRRRLHLPETEDPRTIAEALDEDASILTARGRRDLDDARHLRAWSKALRHTNTDTNTEEIDHEETRGA